MVSLGGLYADPIGAMRRATARARSPGVTAISLERPRTEIFTACVGLLTARGGIRPSRCRHDCVRLATDPSRSDAAGLPVPRRVAVLSVHTSPLAQPGTGDAGGMNVYVLQSALQMARRGVEVEIFTRATSSADPPTVRVAPGVLVRNVVGRAVRGPRQVRPAHPVVRVHRGRAARRSDPRARLLRHRAFALLAVRSGRLAGPRPVGGAAGAHRAHAGGGQERRAGRRRRAGAAAARGRRTAGRRRGRPVDRQHRRRSDNNWFRCTTPIPHASTSCTRVSTSQTFTPGDRRRRACAHWASDTTSRWSRSSAASSR